MTLQRTFDRVRTIDTERVLTVFFLVLASAMFALTFTFEYRSSALFPRLTAGAMIIGSLLLLFQERLPAPLHRIVVEPVSIAEPDDEFESHRPEDEFEAHHSKDEAVDSDGVATTRNVPDAVATYGLLLGYVASSYLIGILWATPVFAYAYARWFERSRASTAIIVGGALAIVFTFYLLVDAPLEDGLLLEWIW